MWDIKGIPASAGIAIGPIMHMQECVHDFCHTVAPKDAPKEKERFLSAQKVAEIELDELKERTATTVGEHQAEVFAAHKQMVLDPCLAEAVFADIDTNFSSAEAAVETATQAIASRLLLLMMNICVSGQLISRILVNV